MSSSVPNSPRLRIVQMAMGREQGGAGNVLLHFAQGMSRHGHDVSVCAFRSGAVTESAVAMGLPAVFLFKSPSSRLKTAFELTLALPRMCSLLRKLQPDIVHVHTYIPDIFGRPAARWAGVPVVVSSVHTNLSNGLGLNGSGGIPGRDLFIPVLVRATDRFTSRFYATSSDVQRELLERGISSNRILRLPNQIDCSKFNKRLDANLTRDRIRSEFGLNQHHFVLGSSGRLEKVKRFDLLVKALAEILPYIPRAKLILPGTGNELEALRSLSISLGVNDHVIFPGWRSDIPDLLSAYDVFLLSSRMEASPLSLLEAMASGLPCVSTNVGGIPDIIIDDSLGILVDSNDYNEFCRQIIALYDNALLRDSLGRKARDHVYKHHNSSDGESIRLLLEDYQQLLDKSKSTAIN